MSWFTGSYGDYYSKKGKILLIAISALIVLGSIVGGILGGKASFARAGFVEEEITIPIKNEVERAVEVKGLENKFIYIKMSLFRGAGAGGLGAPQIFTYSAEQFISLIPQGEPVYVALEYRKTPEGYEDRTVLKKVYWAFIENRAGLMVYEDVYQYQGGGREIKDYNSESVTFLHYYHYGIGFVFLGIFIALAGITGVLIGAFGITNILKNRSFWE